jgi:molybdopterin synthase sulfur carrier subunit
MTVKLNLHPNIRSAIRCPKELYAEGKTLGECIDEMDRIYPGFREKMVGEDGKILKTLKIFVNDANAYPMELDMQLHDGDIVTIITYISGG